MPNRAVGVDQIMNARLLQAVDDADTGCWSDGTGCRLAIASKGKTLKKSAPGRIDGIGMIKPALVVFFDQGSVGPFGNRQRVHENEI